MENPLDLIKWLKKMGYDYEVPELLSNIYNRSTSFVWHELIQNARPKQEAENLRNNVIINRLRSKPLNKQDEFSYPVENLMLYIKKQALQRKLNNLQDSISEKRSIVDNQSKNNKIAYIMIQKVESKIKENREREYLLEKKSQSLEKSVQDAEEMLNHAKNLTPVELEEDSNTADITETLQKCADKLQELLKEIPVPQSHDDNSTQFSRKFYSAQKQVKPQSTFEKYLILSERKLHEKLTISKHRQIPKDMSNKENIPTDRKINKNIFGGTSKSVKKPENKRESLGILPENCLRDIELMDLDDMNIDIFPSIQCGAKNVASVPKPKNVNEVLKSFGFDILFENDFITRNLSNLLHNHNRQSIWNTFNTLNNNLYIKVVKAVILESGSNPERGKNISREDVAQLQFFHIQTELQILKLKCVLKDLSRKVSKKKKSIYDSINTKGLPSETSDEVGRLLELKLEDVCLDVTLAEMKKEISYVKKIENNNDLQITLGKINQAKEDIALKIRSIQQYINQMYHILQSTVYTKETTVACVRKLGPFVEDLAWSLPLTENLYSSEIKSFEKFPLEYNRKCIYTNPGTFYRDIADDIPGEIDLDTDNLYLLSNILESPFSPSETIAIQLLKCKIKLDGLKSLPKYSACKDYKKYNLKELQEQESYVQYALDKLHAIIFSTSANKTLNTINRMKDIVEIWLEMPFKDFISDKRVVDGHDYKFYEKQYDSFYNP